MAVVCPGEAAGGEGDGEGGGAPILAATFGDDGPRKVFAGGLDGVVYQVDMAANKSSRLGRHDKAVSCVKTAYSPDEQNISSVAACVATGSWDGFVRLWDGRANTSGTGSCFDVKLEGKVFCMDFVDNTLLVCTSGRKVHLFDVRKHSATGYNATQTQQRDSSLKYQTRSCALMPNLDGFALGSIEGRCAIEYMAADDVTLAQGKKKYAFKCHRLDTTVYPVNAIDFHARHSTFATGGCDGHVVLWDSRLKKRLVALPRLNTSVSALAIAKHEEAGDLMAVAASYTFEEGEKDHPSDEIYVRKLLDHEVRSR
jgi:cell cycle arrest protein BUB3